MLDTHKIDQQLALDRLHNKETTAAIQEGIASAERGEFKLASQVYQEMRTKFGLANNV